VHRTAVDRKPELSDPIVVVSKLDKTYNLGISSFTRGSHDFGGHFPIGATKQPTENVVVYFRVFLSLGVWFDAV
jgi:hypothetical protein